MNSKTGIILAIALLVFIGSGIGFYVLFSQHQVTTQTETTDTGGNNTPATASSNTPSQSSATPVTTVASLFAKLGAQKVSFNLVTSATGDVGSVYTLYASDIADTKKTFPKLTSFPLSIAMADLNKDGTSEAIVWENLPGICGSGGCPLDIYQKNNGKWTKLFSGIGGSDIAMSTTSTNGYQDLFLATMGDIGYQSKIVRYIWHKTEYVDANVVATWDGTQFVQ